jgi:hypothetical protein
MNILTNMMPAFIEPFLCYYFRIISLDFAENMLHADDTVNDLLLVP